MIRHPLPPPAPEIPQENIRVCAYYLWRAAGCPAGRDLEFWLGAREQLVRPVSFRRPRPRQDVRTTGQEARRYGGRLRIS